MGAYCVQSALSVSAARQRFAARLFFEDDICPLADTSQHTGAGQHKGLTPDQPSPLACTCPHMRKRTRGARGPPSVRTARRTTCAQTARSRDSGVRAGAGARTHGARAALQPQDSGVVRVRVRVPAPTARGRRAARARRRGAGGGNNRAGRRGSQGEAHRLGGELREAAAAVTDVGAHILEPLERHRRDAVVQDRGLLSLPLGAEHGCRFWSTLRQSVCV